MKTDHQRRVEAFMARAGQDLPPYPIIPDYEVRELRAKLILEEAFETVHALGVQVEVRYTGVGADGAVPIDWNGIKNHIKAIRSRDGKIDIVQVADGCADLSVVTVGTLSAFGIQDQPLLEVVDDSNLAKFRGDAHRADDGKWIKPSDWKAPDIADVLRRQGWVG